MSKEFYEWIFANDQKRWGNIGKTQGVDSAVEYFLTPFQGKNIKIVDLGCGNGRTIAHIYRPEWEIWGVDYVFDAVAYANSVLRNKATINLDDMTHTMFPNNYFDVVYSCGAFEHLDIPKFDEPFRILKPDGIFIATLCVGDRGKVETEFCKQTGTNNWGKQWEWELPITDWKKLLEEAGFKQVICDTKLGEVFVCTK